MSFGYFGKLPSRGDFLAKGLPEIMLSPLDEWLRRGLDEAQRQLGGAWREIYLTGPVWRFALSAGMAGPTMAAGILVPSTDRSGRDFPFIIACRAAADRGPAQLAAGLSGWLDRASQLATLAVTRELDPATLDRHMGEMGPPAPPPAVKTVNWRTPGCGTLDTALPALLDQAASSGLKRPALWWSAGSAKTPPTSLMTEDWPPPSQFPALFTGTW